MFTARRTHHLRGMSERLANISPKFPPSLWGKFTLRSLSKAGRKGSWRPKKCLVCWAFLVLPDRIELSTSPLPRENFSSEKLLSPQRVRSFCALALCQFCASPRDRLTSGRRLRNAERRHRKNHRRHLQIASGAPSEPAAKAGYAVGSKSAKKSVFCGRPKIAAAKNLKS